MNFTLYQNISDKQMASQLLQLFADLEYMGIMQKYGTYCLFISSLLAAILREKGHRIELKTCVALISQNQKRFLLGSKEFASADQLATHVVCVVNDSILVDFGLGNAKKYFESNFFQGMVLELQANTKQLGQEELSNGYKLIYVEDETPDDLFTHVAAQDETLTRCLNEYHRYINNRFKFSLARAFRKFNPKRQKSITPSPELRKIAGSFDDTWSH